MAKLKSEVVAKVPGRLKTTAIYTTLIKRGKVWVAENGAAWKATGVHADPYSDYRIKGKDVVRIWEPGEAERMEREEAESAARVRKRAEAQDSGALKRAAALLAKRFKCKAVPVVETTLDDRELPAYVLQTRKTLDVSPVHAALVAQNVVTVGADWDVVKNRPVGLFVMSGTSQFDVLDRMVNICNAGVEVDDVRRFLVALNSDAGVELEAVTHDVLAFTIGRVPPSLAKHARALADLEPDEMTLAGAKLMLKERKVWLWWD